MKRDRIRLKTYDTREAARRDVFDDIELFHHSNRRRGTSAAMSAIDFERHHFNNRLASVQQARGDSDPP